MTDSECRCGLVLPATGGPTHADVSTSPECRVMFGRKAPVISIGCCRMPTWPNTPTATTGDSCSQSRRISSCSARSSATGDRFSAASNITAAAVAIGKAGSGYPKSRRPAAWRSTINEVAGRAISANRYIEDVLSTWEATEGERVAGWTHATLESPYRD